MPTVNLSLTYQSLVTGTVTNPANVYSDDNAVASYTWSGTSGQITARYATNFASAVPAGATVTGYRFLIRCRKNSAGAVYPVPYHRWGTSGGGNTMADHDLTTVEEQYAYPPGGGYYTVFPSDWSTIDFGMTLAPSGSITAEVDQLTIEVNYTEGSTLPFGFMSENF